MPNPYPPKTPCHVCIAVILALMSIPILAESPVQTDNINTTDSNTSEQISTTNPFRQINDTIDEKAAPATETDILASVLLAIVVGLFTAMTVIGNIMVIFAVVLFRRLRTIPNMFVVSLASADLIMGGIVTPLGAHYAIGGNWLLSSFACEIWTSVDVLSVTASIGTLCAISLDRFVAITMPFQYSRRMTRLRARFIIASIWIVSALIAFVPIHLEWWKTSIPDDVACYEDPYCCEFRTNKVYALVSSCVSFYIPLIIMIIAYSVVFRIALQQRTVIRNSEGVFRRASMPGTRRLLWGNVEYKAVFTMGIIMGTFVVCWLPFFIVNVTTVLVDNFISESSFMVLNWIGYANSCFNPIIYCHSKEFRRAFKRIIQCGLCRDGYQRTSRASLSISYTPTASSRSSVREGSLYHLTSFFFSGRNSSSRRVSRMSTSSAKSFRRSPINGQSPNHNSRYKRSFNDQYRSGQNGRYATGNRNEVESSSESGSSSGIIVNSFQQSNGSTELCANLQVRKNSHANVEFPKNAAINIRVNQMRQQRSRSLHLSLTPDVCKRLLFKSKSHHNVNEDEEKSDSHRLLSNSSSDSNQNEIKSEKQISR